MNETLPEHNSLFFATCITALAQAIEIYQREITPPARGVRAR